MADQNGYVTLTAGNTSLVLDCAIGERPSILYWGSRLSKSDPELIKAMTSYLPSSRPSSGDVNTKLLAIISEVRALGIVVLAKHTCAELDNGQGSAG